MSRLEKLSTANTPGGSVSKTTRKRAGASERVATWSARLHVSRLPGVVELQKCDGSCTFRYFGELSEQFVRNAKFSAL